MEASRKKRAKTISRTTLANIMEQSGAERREEKKGQLATHRLNRSGTD